MFDFIYHATQEATSPQDLASRLKDRHIDARKINQLLITAAACLALEEQHEKVKWLWELGASADEIARAYAMKANHRKVMEYQLPPCNASVDRIAEGYAFAGNTLKVGEYRTKYKASVHAIARGYALAGNGPKVAEYQRIYKASVHEIARGYALAGNAPKAEE